MQFGLSEEQEMIVATVRSFVEREIFPHEAAVERSGPLLSRWAREHGIDARSLNAWRLNLARRAGRTAGSTAGAPLRLVELVPFERPACYRVFCGPFAVELGGSIDTEQVARLLAAMAAAC